MSAEKVSVVGNESYDDRFTTFLKSTNQKKLTAEIFNTLLGELKSKADILDRDRLTILDVGCGEGTLAKQLIPAIRTVYAGPIDYIGVDYNESFVEQFKSALSPFEGVTVTGKTADAFTEEGFDVNNADIVVASHMIYHSYSPSDKEGSLQKAANFVDNVVNSLGKDSIAIMIHEARHSDMRETATKYGSELMPNAPDVIQSYCDKENVSYAEVPFAAELTFPKIKPGWWDLLKNTKTMSIARQIPELNQTLHLLGFVMQRDFIEMEAEGQLAPFVSEIQTRLAKSENNNLTIRSNIQVLMSQDRSIGFSEGIKECCSEVNSQVKAIQEAHSIANQVELV